MTAVLLLALAAQAADVQTARLRDGSSVTGSAAVLDGDVLRFSDGRAFPRESVVQLELAASPRAEAEAVRPADAALAARGRRLFEQARAFGRKHPGSDGLVLSEAYEGTVRADGTWVERWRFAGVVLKEETASRWGRVETSYEEGRQRARIVEAVVHHPDGRSFPFEPGAVVASAPQAGELFFDDARQLAYALPRVEVGSIVEWTTEKETYNPFRKDFYFPHWGFVNRQPTLSSRFEVTVPAGRKLYWSARRFAGPKEPRVTTRGGATTYAWEVRETAALPNEPNAAPYFDVVPNVKAALIGTWAPIHDWLAEMYEQRTKAGAELAEAARRLAEPRRTQDEKIAALYHYVQKEVRYIAVKMGPASGWGGYDANLTWKRRFGCCIDKAILLTAMLREIGVPASPVLVDTNQSARHDFSVPDIWFEHAITRVRAGGRDFLLDSTGSDYAYPSYPQTDQGVSVLDPMAREIVPGRLPPPEDNADLSEYSLTLNAAGDAAVRASFRHTGARDGDTRGYFKGQKPSEQRRFFEEWVNALGPSGKLESYAVENMEDLDKPASYSMRFTLPGYAIRAGDLSIFELPSWERYFGEVGLDKRALELRYDSSALTRRSYSVTLPPGFELASAPAKARIAGPGESYEQDCALAGPVLSCSTTLRREARTYAPSEYRAHKAFLERVSKLSKDRLFLRRTGR